MVTSKKNPNSGDLTLEEYVLLIGLDERSNSVWLINLESRWNTRLLATNAKHAPWLDGSVKF